VKEEGGVIPSRSLIVDPSCKAMLYFQIDGAKEFLTNPIIFRKCCKSWIIVFNGSAP